MGRHICDNNGMSQLGHVRHKQTVGRPKAGSPQRFWKTLVTDVSAAQNWSKVECNYCAKQFAGVAGRVYTHISGIGGGLKQCVSKEIPEDILEACNAQADTGGRDAGRDEANEQRRTVTVAPAEEEQQDVAPGPSDSNTTQMFQY